MAVNKILFTVLLSSPSDVPSEREVVYNIIEEINQVYKNSKFGLILKTWENDVSPSLVMNTGQNLIDLEFNYKQADLLIGIFYKKLGTPVLDSESGTVHEIQEAINSFKLNSAPNIKLYFKRVNISLSDTSIEELEQFNKLTNKKREYMNFGIIQDFENSSDFEARCRTHILKFFNDKIESYNHLPLIKNKNVISVKTRKDFERMEEILDRAENEIFINGINLEGALNAIDLLHKKAYKGVRIKLLALNPDETLLFYFNMNEISVDVKKNKIVSNLKIITDKLNHKNVEIRLIDRIFVAGCVGIDMDIKDKGRIIAQQYLNGVGTSVAPALDIYNSNNKDIYDSYHKYILELWKLSKTYKGGFTNED
jgi:hypothetical protein